MTECTLNVLAQRIQQGDRQAKAEFREHLEPSLVRIVRRVLEKGTATCSLERKILATARRLMPEEVLDSSHSEAIAQNLCRMVLTRLCSGVTERGLQTVVDV